MKKTRKILVFVLVCICVAFFGVQSRVSAVEYQRCKLGDDCTVGEYLYDDEYAPITDATCTLNSRNPDGTVYLNNVAMTSASEDDGWYSYTFDTTGKTEGIYRTQLCCTSGDEYMCLDKTYTIGASYLSSTDVSSAVWSAQTASHAADGTFGKNLQNAAPTTSEIWNYSTRSLSSFGTLIADIWSYSTRSVTTFGTLVTDIWASATRTLTGATLTDGGELATKTDIEVATTSAVTSIKGASNKDLTQVSTQVSGVQTTADSIETKVDTLTTQVASLSTSISTVSTNVNTLVTKWSTYTMSDVITRLDTLQTDLGTNANTCSDDTIFGNVQCVRDKWGSQTADALYTAANNAATTAEELQAELDYNGKSSTAYEDIQDLQATVSEMQGLIGSTSDAATTATLFGRIKKAQDVIDTLDSTGADLAELMDKWGDYSAGDIYDKVKNLSSEISAVNTVANVSSILTLSTSAKVDLATIKNSILSLTALTELNKTLLQEGTNKPIIKTWLEEGSIIFKSLITNPTAVTQTVPFKFYLPKEATKKDIEKIDENLTVGYDPSNEATYVVGEFELKPHETKITFVEVEDVWRISTKDVDSLRLQNKELFAPLKNTPLFAQGATLSSNITAALDNVERIQDKADTPEERIQAYREAIIDFNRAKSDLQSLTDLLASSGSTSSLLGFVGGVQVLAVWGLIIILITGFVFLALYMRYITGPKEERGRPLSRIRQNPSMFQFPKGSTLTRILFILLSVVIGAVLIIVIGKFIFARTTTHDSYVSPVPVSGDKSRNTHVTSPADEVTIKEPKQVLGISTSVNKALIYVDTTGVNVREGPSEDTRIVFVFKKTTEVSVLGNVDSWTQIEYVPTDGLQAEKGWVKSFFISNLGN